MRISIPLLESVKKRIQRLILQRKPVIINDRDIIEHEMKGSGPGGQAVNKTNNAICLIHKPTGIQVRSHKTRYAELNRKDARKLLEAELDKLINGDCSKESLKNMRERERKRISSRKSAAKHSKTDHVTSVDAES